MEFAARQADAHSCILLARNAPDAWKQFSVWTSGASPLAFSPQFITDLQGVADTSVEAGSAWAHLGDPAESGGGGSTLVVGLRLEEEETSRVCVAMFLIFGNVEADLETTVLRLLLLADAPAIYQRERAARKAALDTVHFAEALDVMALMNAEKHYQAAAMILVNETAAKYLCSRVSLGWLEKGYLRLQAINHMDNFDKNMEIVDGLEAAMEEAFDQDEEILLPPPDDHGPVTRDHGNYSRQHNVPHMLSLPIRLDGESAAVLTCERESVPFSEDEVRGIRVLCDQTARRLGDLKAYDRPLWAKSGTAVRDRISSLLGIEHTLGKVVGLAVFVLLFFINLVKLNYRVEAPFILKSQDVRQVSVPFEGYIDEVGVKIGQEVEQGDLLLSLDAKDLVLEEFEAVANQLRYFREAEKAQARNMLADMKIAQAQAEQAGARLALVQYRLSQAQLRSPIKGIVVEGDLEELRGAPVNKGDILFKVARNENLFAEIKVNERDIHELSAGQTGEVAFVSQPQLKFAVNVKDFDPMAESGDAGNFFNVRCAFGKHSAPWWRPGMSGIAKIDVGKRSIFWILTHRTLDFIRMRLWW